MTDQDGYSDEAAKVAYARDRREWLDALTAEGFSREEALAILTVPLINVGGVSPEFSEMAAKVTAMLNQNLSES